MMKTIAANSPSITLRQSQKRGLLLLCIFVFPVLLTSVLFSFVVIIGDIDLTIHQPETPFAKISSPKNRSIVSKQFTISGDVKDPLPGHSYYLMEYRENRYWPKYDLGNKAIEWKKNLTHRAKQDQFSAYRIIMADPQFKKHIDDWFISAKKTGKYPGINDIGEQQIVANLRLKSL